MNSFAEIEAWRAQNGYSVEQVREQVMHMHGGSVMWVNRWLEHQAQVAQSVQAEATERAAREAAKWARISTAVGVVSLIFAALAFWTR